ncbi:MAG: GatB/YqeY domain-containing protein [Bacteroidetes bacterium]|nr:MAG: GatB/YqeY domain-containing protein [Bacteroidota bacterium]
MTLAEQINHDIKKAMLAKDKKRLDALRAVKSAILLAATEKGAKDEVDDSQVMKILQKLAKQRLDAAQIYREQNRNDLAEEEEFQAKVIQEYLPQPLSAEEIKTELQKIIEETGASSKKDFGKVMGLASKKLAGKAEGKTISEILKTLLQ